MGNKSLTKPEFTPIFSRLDSIRSANIGCSNVIQLPNDCSLIWLDANVRSNIRDEFLRIKSQLNGTFSSLITFDDIDQCIECIITETKLVSSLFVITNCLFSKRIIEEIHNFHQVKLMYLSCRNIADDYKIKCFEKNIKIRNIYDDVSIMFDDLIYDLKQFMIPNGSIGLSTLSSVTNGIGMSIRDSNSDTIAFIWSYLFLTTLIEAPTTAFDKKILLNHCEAQLQNNNEEISRFEEFANAYTSRKVIYWCLHDSFIFKLVNQTLRTESINGILKVRLFIHDLHNQLKYVQSQQSPVDIKNVYCGCQILVEDFISLQKNIGNQIVFNTFVFATIDRQIALIHAGNGENRPHLKSVLVQIQIDNTNHSTSCFADVRQFSRHTLNEKEVLFSVGTICHVITIDKISDTNVWFVSLKLSEIMNNELKHLIKQIRKDLRDSNELLTVGNYLCQMGLYDEAEQHYLRLRTDSWKTNSTNEKAAILTGLIRSSTAQDKLSVAMEYCDEAEKLLSQHNIEVHRARKLWIELGNFYREKQMFFPASQCYSRCCSWSFCNMEEEECVQCNLLLAEQYINVGIMDLDYNSPDRVARPEAALEEFKRSLSIHKQFLPENHLLFAIDNYHLGLVEQRIGSSIDAMNYFEQTLQILLPSLSNDHLLFAEVYLRLGNMYFMKEDNINALLNYEHALYIQLLYLPRNHRAFAHTYNGLGECYQHQNDFYEAAKYFKKAYNHYPQTANEDRYIALRSFHHCDEAATIKKTLIQGLYNHHNSNSVDAAEKLAADFRNIPKSVLFDGLKKENIELSSDGTELRCRETLTRSQMKILYNFCKKDCGIKLLQINRGKIAEDDNDSVLIGEALRTNTSLDCFELSTCDNPMKKDNCDISLTNIKSISSAISINQTLKTIIISKLTVEGIRILADGLYNNSTLIELNLSNNTFSSTSVFKYLIQSLHVNQSIKTLSLRSTQFGYHGSISVAEMLKINRTITHLDLYNNQIPTKGASAIGEALKINHILTHLDLSKNKINSDGLRTFGEAMLAANPHGLQTLNLSTNNLGPEDLQYLAVGLKENASLTRLDLHWNKIFTQGLEIIDSVLMMTRKLDTLNLSHNEIGSTKHLSTYIYDGLSNNCSMTRLELQNNSLTGTTIRPIIKALQTNHSLTTLLLDSNRLGDDGTEVIGNWLMENEVLQTLSLKNNNIGDTGVMYICDVLKRNRSLIKLSIDMNIIGDTGASMLADALTHNTALKELSVVYNKMTKQGIEELRAVKFNYEKYITLRLDTV